jgi:hypothetical protein
LDQERPGDAVDVLLIGLSRYEEAAKRSYDSNARAMEIDWLRMFATDWRTECPGQEGLDLVIEKVDAMSLDT